MGDVCAVGLTSSGFRLRPQPRTPRNPQIHLLIICISLQGCMLWRENLARIKEEQQQAESHGVPEVVCFPLASSVLPTSLLGTRGRSCTKNDLLIPTCCVTFHQLSAHQALLDLSSLGGTQGLCGHSAPRWPVPHPRSTRCITFKGFLFSQNDSLASQQTSQHQSDPSFYLLDSVQWGQEFWVAGYSSSC